LQPHRDPARLRGRDGGLRLGHQLQAGQAGGFDVEALCGFGRVHDLQPVDVLDRAFADDARQAAAVTHHVHLERRAQGQAGGQ